MTRRIWVLALAVALGACANGKRVGERLPPPLWTMPPDTPASVVSAEPVGAVDPGPRRSSRVQIFDGSDVFTGTSARAPATASTPGDITLDFAEADVRDVARTVLGDILKVSYTVDAAVQGRVTLKTSTPLSRDDLLPAFEATLKSIASALVVSDGIYAVVPMADARARAGAASMAAASSPGFGIEVVKLSFVSAEEMRKLVEPLAPPGGIVSVDNKRGLVIIAGTAPERKALRETMRLFDVDVLKATSFALVTPQYASAGALAADLTAVISDSAVKIVALERLNAILLTANRRTTLEQAVQWVERFDMPSAGTGRQLYYYRLQSARATDVAKSLATVIGDGGTAVAVAGAAAESAASPQPQTADGAAASPAPAAPPRSSATGDSSKSSVVADEANNALVIKATASEFAAMEIVLAEMDRAPDQVLIEATIAEVSLDDQLRYGVEWFFQNGGQGFTLAESGQPAARFPGFAFTYVVPDVRVAINTLASVTDVNVVSSPKLLTLDNKAATLQVGDQVPIIVQSAQGVENPTAPVVNSVQFRDTGILLTVTPRIGRSGMVVLDVSQEVSDAIPTETSGIDSPTIRQRRLETTVAIRDGQTVALGGLMRQSRTIGESGVPILKDIPLLGDAFSTDSDNRGKTELLIFIRPRIIRNPAAAGAMTRDLTSGVTDLRAMFRELGGR